MVCQVLSGYRACAKHLWVISWQQLLEGIIIILTSLKSQTLVQSCHLWPRSAVRVLWVQGCAQEIRETRVATAAVVM